MLQSVLAPVSGSPCPLRKRRLLSLPPRSSGAAWVTRQAHAFAACVPACARGNSAVFYLCFFLIHLGKNGTRENNAQEIWGLGLNPNFTGARLDGPLPGACAVLRLVVLQPDRDAAILLLQHEAAAAAASEARALRA